MDKMRMESVDITAQNIEKISSLFPNCITEMLDEEKSTIDNKVYKKAVNFEMLKQMLSGNVLDGDEAYEFTWVGKKAAIVEANTPIKKTLRPCPEESVNWDSTENLYIEGDNLEVLKLLQESYLGKVKMIYIDPPYNSRQYCDAYHLLENVAVWNKPQVYGVAKKMDRTDLKSRYCTNKAVEAFDDLIKNCNCKYILVSYNNTGDKSNSRSNAKISDLQIKEILEKKGKVKVFEQSYNNFTTGKSTSIDHKERLFLCETAEVSEKSQIQLEDNKNFAKSPLNYTGGKYKLLPQFENIFPKKIDTFVDFFCGGANVAVNSNANKIIAIDKETNLIRILDLFKNYDYMEIVNKLDSIIEKYNLSNTYKNGYKFYGENSSSGLGKYNKPYYLKLRDDYNHMKDSIERDFMFLTLVIYAFNHQIRFNNNGEYNMPVGKRDFNSSIRKNLLEFCRKLVVKNISFVNTDYKKFKLDSLTSNDFCYFDPPYYLGDASYNENDGWNENKEKELLEYLNEVDKHGIKFALSNVTEHKGLKNEMLINWAIENQYNIHNLNYNYSNSNYHLKNKNQVTKEVLITNY